MKLRKGPSCFFFFKSKPFWPPKRKAKKTEDLLESPSTTEVEDHRGETERGRGPAKPLDRQKAGRGVTSEAEGGWGMGWKEALWLLGRFFCFLVLVFLFLFACFLVFFLEVGVSDSQEAVGKSVGTLGDASVRK